MLGRRHAGRDPAEPQPSRTDRLAAEARRQGLALTRLPGNEWHLIPLEASPDWKLLSRQRQRLPDGRVLSIRMSLDDVEAFLLSGWGEPH
jgi:hypothetical protein